MTELRTVQDAGVILHLALAGRLDLTGAERIEADLSRLVTARPRATVVDVSEVTFLASAGLGVMVSVAKALRVHGKPLVLYGAQPLVASVLRLAALENLLAIEADRESALRRASA